MYKAVGILFLVFAQLILSAPNAAANKLPPPGHLIAMTSTKVDGAVELKWSPVKGATSYTVAASRETEDNWQVLDTPTGTEFQVNELPEATKYYFRIASNSRFGQGDWSTSVMQFSSGKKRMHASKSTIKSASNSPALAVNRQTHKTPHTDRKPAVIRISTQAFTAPTERTIDSQKIRRSI